MLLKLSAKVVRRISSPVIFFLLSLSGPTPPSSLILFHFISHPSKLFSFISSRPFFIPIFLYLHIPSTPVLLNYPHSLTALLTSVDI